MLLWSAPRFRGRPWHRAKATADELFSRLYEPLKRVIAQRLEGSRLLRSPARLFDTPTRIREGARLHVKAAPL